MLVTRDPAQAEFVEPRRYAAVPAFNTVVLFDVENLLGAPAGWKTAAAKLSFGDILGQLRRDESGLIDGFAVSRAYANWGQDFMATPRLEMTDNGVEPRQIYGFDRGGTKNAADIELVIDALDLAYLRPGLSTFVLVTRDGGFSALVRKLHELGKTVVVCADATCSHTLRAVADVFIDLPQTGDSLPPVAGRPSVTSDQILDETREKVVAEVEAMASADGKRLEREGIPLTVLGARLAKAIPDLGNVRSGYAGLKEFLQWALVGTPYCVIDKIEGPEGARKRLGRRSGAPRGFRQLPNLERRAPLQFAETATLYRYLAGQGDPYLRLADPQSTAQVLRQVAETGIDDEELSTVTDRIAAALSGGVAAADVKFTILSLAYSGAMPGRPERAAVEERRYRLAEGDAGPLREALLATARAKLETRLETVDDAVLQGLVEA
jgi:hypothetical protein